MRPLPPLLAPTTPSPGSASSRHSLSSGSPSTSPPWLSLTLTVRYLPTDEWETLSVPVEWRALDVKRLGLKTFQDGHHSRTRDPARPAKSSRSGRQWHRDETAGYEKENERGSRGAGEAMLSVAGGEKDKKTPNGVKRFAHALRDRLSSKDLNAATSLSSPHLLPMLTPSRHSISASSTPTVSDFNLDLDTPTRHRIRRSEETHSRRSSIANFESLQFSVGVKKSEAISSARGPEDVEGGGEEEILLDTDASPLAGATSSTRMERSKSLSERNQDLSPLVHRSRKSPSTLLSDQVADHQRLASWVLVNAVTGGTVPDHAIVGSKFVENDILTLKPSNLLYDPPLHLYHLPFLHFPSAFVLPASLATCQTTFDYSNSPFSKGHSRRRSFGGRYAKEELVDRRIEISVDDGVYAAAQGDRGMTPGTTMVLRVIKSTQLEALYPLPPRSIQLVSSGSAASAPPPPSLPSSSSTASLAHFVLPSGSTNLRHSIGPQAAPAVSSRRKAKSLPVIQLSWDDGESLALRAKSDEDHARLLKVLGEPTDEDEESDEVEAQSRKDLLDLAFASRHHLVPVRGPIISSHATSSPTTLHDFSVTPSPDHSAASCWATQDRARALRPTSSAAVSARPSLQLRSASDSSAVDAKSQGLSTSRSSRALPVIVPKRSSSILHIRKLGPEEASRSDSPTPVVVEAERPLYDEQPESHERTPSSTSSSTVLSSSSSLSIPLTPTSSRHHQRSTTVDGTPTTTTMVITPATPHYSPPAKADPSYSPASILSSSSSYFSLHSAPLPPPPLVIPRFSRSSSTNSLTRAKSSLDLTSAIRASTSPMSSLKTASFVDRALRDAAEDDKRKRTVRQAPRT